MDRIRAVVGRAVSSAGRRRRRILIAVHSARTGGAQLMALAATEHLANRYELHIAVPRGPLFERFAAHGQVLRASPTMPLGWGTRERWLRQGVRSQFDAARIAAHVRRHDIRVVYVNSTVLLGPVLGALPGRVPSIVHARELPPDRPARALFGALATLATAVIVVSGAVERSFGVRRRARFVKIPDGIPIPPDVPIRRQPFHSPLRLCLIGTIGDGRKGQDIAIESLARLSAAGVDATLELVGPIADQTAALQLRERADALGVGAHVALTGATDRIDEVITEADIVLSCAREEPLGLTLMEALALERPVVASRVGGVPEIIRDGDTGVLVPVQDPVAVAEAVKSLAADPDEALAMARRGRLDIAARFDRRRGLQGLEAELARYVQA